MEKEMIRKIVKASGVKPGELVLVQLWGEVENIGIIHSFATAIAQLGASPVEILQSRTVNTERFSLITESAFSEKYFRYMSYFDAVIDIFCYQPVVLHTKLDDMQMSLYQNYMGSLFSALSGVKRFTQIRVPTQENASEANLPSEDYIDRMTAAYDIDFDILFDSCKAEVSELTKNDFITLLTGKNHRLCFNLSGRKWYIDAGDGDIPCGEVYIAPVETDTNGSIYFEKLYAGDWGTYYKTTLTVLDGIIVSTSDEILSKHLNDLDKADKTICELGFGMNPNVKTLCGYTALDEKAYGSFHIAIGTNTMFGGNNKAKNHRDFVGFASIEPTLGVKL